MAVPFSFSFDFLGDAGSVEELEYNGTLTAELDDLIQIDPLKKVALTNVVAQDLFVADGWGAWNESPRAEILGTEQNPLGFFELRIAAKKPNETPLSLATINFFLTRDSDGPRNWQWRNSFDDFQSPTTVHNIPDEAIEAGVVHDEGIIELPSTPPLTPTAFGLFGIDCRQLAETEPLWRAFPELVLRLYGYYKEGD
jgi:hypothetical protein